MLILCNLVAHSKEIILFVNPLQLKCAKNDITWKNISTRNREMFSFQEGRGRNHRKQVENRYNCPLSSYLMGEVDEVLSQGKVLCQFSVAFMLFTLS